MDDPFIRAVDTWGPEEAPRLSVIADILANVRETPAVDRARELEQIALTDDPLLDSVRRLRREIAERDETLRALLVLARVTNPKYPLRELADAAGMTPSGVRTSATSRAVSIVLSAGRLTEEQAQEAWRLSPDHRDTTNGSTPSS